MAVTHMMIIVMALLMMEPSHGEKTFYIKPQDCQYAKPDNCICPEQCITLSEYAQNSTDTYSSATKLLLYPGEHKLYSDLVIENTSNISLMAVNSSSPTVINCVNDATIVFENVSDLTMKGITFISSGKKSSTGLRMLNTSGLMVNITMSRSVGSGLVISTSTNIIFHNLAVVNNANSDGPVVKIENSDVSLTGTTLVANNSIGGSMLDCNLMQRNEAILQITQCNLEVQNLTVRNNSNPTSIVKITDNTLSGSPRWSFENNRVCTGGVLFLDNLEIVFNGTITFTNNSENANNVSGIYIKNCQFNIAGDISFHFGSGNLVAMYSINSNIAVTGSMQISQNFDGKQGIVLSQNSQLDINGLLDMSNNNLSFLILRVSSDSEIKVNGETVSVNNPLITPLVSFNGKITLNGITNFTGNAGTIYGFESTINISGTSSFVENNLKDDYVDGTLAVERSNLIISGNFSFEGNQVDTQSKNGGGIYAIIESNVTLSGNGSFINNTAKYGGAIYLDQMTTINIAPDTSLLFHHNKAVKGGAIFIQASLGHLDCSSEVNFFPCLFQLPSNSTVNNISISFAHNKGNPGASVLHANIDGIDINEATQTFTALDNLHKIFPLQLNDSNSKPYYYSDSYFFCFCTNGLIENCDSNKKIDMIAIKGKPFSVSVKAVKVYGDNIDEPVRSNLESSALRFQVSNSSITSMLDGCFQKVSNNECKKLSFTVNSARSQETILLNVGESFLARDKTLHVNVTFEPTCPLGFTFNEANDECICNSHIEKHLSKCNLTEETFQKKQTAIRFWMGAYNHTTSIEQYDNCPRGYCVTDQVFSFFNDSICDNNRTGQLCGKCLEGCSLLLGGVKCVNCSNKNAYLALLVVFAALGIILVAFIFLFQMTVAMGTINGLILYMNIVDANQSILLPLNFFQGYTIFISWLNLDFGIDGICFYDGMDHLQYAAWQFVFPLYLWLMVGAIVVACHYSVRISTFFGSSDPVAVLATVILLTYNSIVQNVINIFSPAHLVTPNESPSIVWRFNGEISYGTGLHLVLIVIALVFTVFFFFPFTTVLMSSQVLQKFNFTSKILQRLRLPPFIKAYQIPFKPVHRYWLGLCLMMRSLLLVMFNIVESEDAVLLAIISFCILSLTMFGVTGGVYTKHWLNILEISFVLNLGMLSAARLYVPINNKIDIISYLSVTISFVSFLGIVAYHIYHRLKKLNRVKEVIEKIKGNKLGQGKKSVKKKIIVTQNSVSIEFPSTTEDYSSDLRESLLESLN